MVSKYYLFSLLVKTYLVTKLFKQDYAAQFNAHIPNKQPNYYLSA